MKNDDQVARCDLPASHLSAACVEWIAAYTFLLSPRFLELRSQLRWTTLHKCQCESQIKVFHSKDGENVQTEHFL